jgi:hypothetical protein
MCYPTHSPVWPCQHITSVLIGPFCISTPTFFVCFTASLQTGCLPLLVNQFSPWTHTLAQGLFDFSKSISFTVLNTCHTRSLLQPRWQETLNTFRTPLQSNIYHFLCAMLQMHWLVITSWLLLQGPFCITDLCALTAGQPTTGIKPWAGNG